MRGSVDISFTWVKWMPAARPLSALCNDRHERYTRTILKEMQ